MTNFRTAPTRAEERLGNGPYPHFGGRVLRQRLRGHPAVIALTLLAAIGAAGAAMIPQSSEAHGAGPQRIHHPVSRPAITEEVRTTAKGDRLVPPARHEAGCIGVWGNEPLECLLQTV